MMEIERETTNFEKGKQNLHSHMYVLDGIFKKENVRTLNLITF